MLELRKGPSSSLCATKRQLLLSSLAERGFKFSKEGRAVCAACSQLRAEREHLSGWVRLSVSSLLAGVRSSFATLPNIPTHSSGPFGVRLLHVCVHLWERSQWCLQPRKLPSSFCLSCSLLSDLTSRGGKEFYCVFTQFTYLVIMACCSSFLCYFSLSCKNSVTTYSYCEITFQVCLSGKEGLNSFWICQTCKHFKDILKTALSPARWLKRHARYCSECPWAAELKTLHF